VSRVRVVARHELECRHGRAPEHEPVAGVRASERLADKLDPERPAAIVRDGARGLIETHRRRRVVAATNPSIARARLQRRETD
jgi:hypothetical protein